MTYFINLSHQPVCLYVHPLMVIRQRLGQSVHAAMNTSKNRRMAGHECLCVSLCITLSLLEELDKGVPAATINY
jgi:hypothetical protein